MGHGDGSDEFHAWRHSEGSFEFSITSPSAERCDPIALMQQKNLYIYIWYFRAAWEWPTMHGEVWSGIIEHANHAWLYV